MGSGGSTTQYRNRDPMPQELTNLGKGLYDVIMPTLRTFNVNDWNNAKGIANNAIGQQSALISQLPSSINQQNEMRDLLFQTAKTGNLPSGLTDNLNASVNQELKSNLGSMLNDLANRGVVNSSITSQGINSLAQQVTDSYNRNYMNAYHTALGGMSSALQGSQNNTEALLSAIKGVGDVPGSAYKGVAAGITPATSMWKDWTNAYYGHEDYDTVVKSGK